MQDRETNPTSSIGDTTHKLELRYLTPRRLCGCKELMDVVYLQVGGAWPLKNYQAQFDIFPEGQIFIKDMGKVVADAITVFFCIKKIW